MKYVPFRLLFLLTFILFVTSLFGKTDELSLLDEFQFAEPDSQKTPVPDQTIKTDSSSSENAKRLPKLGPKPDLGSEPDLGATAGVDGTFIKTAAIDGIQISSEPGEKPDEKAITCYFIFQDKPSSYFYEVKLKEKKIVFEFNDTKKSDSLITIAAELPIKDIKVDQKQINVNEEVKGLKSEYHSQVRIIFNMDAVPKIQVFDELNIISFTFKWNMDPAKQKEYIVVDNSGKVILWSAAGVASVGLGALVYRILFPPPAPEGPKSLPVDDLPSCPTCPKTN
jgi:hypothetical protein